MRYQLVLQFHGNALDNLDAIAALEENLIEQLAGFAEVDGHDIGSEEANVFVLTSDPVGTFGAIRPILDRVNLLTAATVAYRPVNGQTYTVVWPAQSNEVFHVA
jgi:hypothetical protein